MSASVLIDTNVLVYAYDRGEPRKQQRALDVLDRLVRTETGALSTQVLSEWFVTVTRKLQAPLSIADATERLGYLVQAWPVLNLSPMIVLEAARGVRDHQFSFWDAQIWATARLNQITLVLSEDFNVGATVEGVTFANPFADDFVWTDWV
jgi:predicted nucleic acid-binding protein